MPHEYKHSPSGFSLVANVEADPFVAVFCNGPQPKSIVVPEKYPAMMTPPSALTARPFTPSNFSVPHFFDQM
jgi:hypothetical protein